MSLSTRKELCERLQTRYKKANWKNKSKILDEFIATSGYRRKYAITLLNQKKIEISAGQKERKLNNKKYDEAVRQALLTIWNAANQICSKRLAPFIPELLVALERFKHISLPIDVRNRLLKISAATIDRLLETQRREARKGLCTTRSGTLLKKQITIRTFADWDNVVPGFLEGDLVAHCGEHVNGSFLNTFVLTDIASTWTEFFPLLRKSEADVIAALDVAQNILPFKLLGLDTDNGSEFINYALLDFCRTKEITFTRSRAYKKNDQAHVEEKNGSIVRRLIGYDRYEGIEAHSALAEVYSVLRLYVNFFQPSLKLLSKKRDGARVTKKYDKAKTPYQRLLASSHISVHIKEKLTHQYNTLDPLVLLKDLEKKQANFWQHAVKVGLRNLMALTSDIPEKIDNITSLMIARGSESDKNKSPEKAVLLTDHQINRENNSNLDIWKPDSSATQEYSNKELPINIKRHRHPKKQRKQRPPRTWRTHIDPFDTVWSKIRMQLELNTERTAKSLLNDLIKDHPDKFNLNLLRTLQRRVKVWRKEQMNLVQKRNAQNSFFQDNSAANYLSQVAHSIING